MIEPNYVVRQALEKAKKELTLRGYTNKTKKDYLQYLKYFLTIPKSSLTRSLISKAVITFSILWNKGECLAHTTIRQSVQLSYIFKR